MYKTNYNLLKFVEYFFNFERIILHKKYYVFTFILQTALNEFTIIISLKNVKNQYVHSLIINVV